MQPHTEVRVPFDFLHCAVEGKQGLKHVGWQPLDADERAEHAADDSRVRVSIASHRDRLPDAVKVVLLSLTFIKSQEVVISQYEGMLDESHEFDAIVIIDKSTAIRFSFLSKLPRFNEPFVAIFIFVISDIGQFILRELYG